MSISDLIVVMKDGVVHQIGKPQEVYDKPVNLFVAKFLGTPPINVFDGCVKAEKLYIGGQPVLDILGVQDQDVVVGIRPEGFVLDGSGPLMCKLNRVEVMGRDISVVCQHQNCENAAIRAIIDAENDVDTDAQEVRFSLRASKVHIFSKETEQRIAFIPQ